MKLRPGAGGRAAASVDPGGYQAGNTAGRIGAQTMVISPALKLGGAALSMIPKVGPVIGNLVAGTAGEVTPGLPGVVARTTAGATTGALGGGASAALTGDDPIRGMVEGGLFGTGLSAGAQGLQRALQTLRGTWVPPEVRNLATGSWGASAETAQRATQAQTLVNEGVPVQVRQITGDPAFKSTDAPWSGASGDIANQQEALRRAALAKVTGQGNGSGTGPTLATDDFVTDQGNRISGNFQGVANRNNIDFANDVAPGLTRIGMTPMAKADRDALAPYLQGITNSVTRDPTTGRLIITGQKYLDLTNSKSDLETLASGGGMPGKYAQDAMDVLHNGLAASASPADQALLKASKDQYRALQAVKTARGSDGSFEPKDLVSATDAQSKRYGGSQGTIDPLANAGNTVLQPSYGGSGKVASVVGSVSGGIPGAIGTAAGHVVPGLLGSMSGPGIVATGAGALGVPLALQVLNRSPAAMQRAIDLLRRGAPYTGYTGLPLQVQGGVIGTQQQ